MQLIGVLAAGVNGAASGHAEIFVRGTSTRATYYTSAEGVDLVGASTAISTGANINLDPNGGASIYVNRAVDVRVYDVSGTLVRAFTEMCASPDVEVRSASFTGLDYTTGAGAAGNPTTLQNVLDEWYTSAGATDFNVMLGGAVTSIQNALGILGGVFINVKSPEYGAVGDGVTDDTAPIQAALDYAHDTRQDLVYFPQGEYLVTGLTLPGGVCLMGSGAANSKIVTNDTDDNVLITTGELAEKYTAQCISDLTFGHNAASDGQLLLIDRAVFMHFHRCAFLGQYCNDNVIEYETGSDDDALLAFTDCLIAVGEQSAKMLALDADPMRVQMTGCMFHVVEGYGGTSLIDARNSLISNCWFNNAEAVAPAEYSCILQVGDCVAVGNHFGSGGTDARVYGFELADVDESVRFVEVGNSFQGGAGGAAYYLRPYKDTIAYTSASYPNYGSTYCLGSRESMVDYIAGNTTPLALDTARYGVHVITHSDNAAKTITDAQAGEHVPGQRLTVIVHQTTMGGGLVELIPGFRGSESFTLAQDSYAVQQFVAVYYSSGKCDWVCVSHFDNRSWV
jgi:hypothetical protein